MIWIFVIIFFISFILALRSMDDFQVPKEIRRILDSKRIKGTILFFKGKKTKHYSSLSS